MKVELLSNSHFVISTSLQAAASGLVELDKVKLDHPPMFAMIIGVH